MKYLKVFASKSEKKRLLKMLKDAQSTPMIALTSEQALSGRDFASMAWDHLKKETHKTALKHGLPEIRGYYGIDLKSGEFVSH